MLNFSLTLSFSHFFELVYFTLMNVVQEIAFTVEFQDTMNTSLESLVIFTPFDRPEFDEPFTRFDR